MANNADYVFVTKKLNLNTIMKCSLPFVILLACLCYGHAYSFSGPVAFLRDSVPDQQAAALFKSRLFAPEYEQTHKQMLTLLIQPSETTSDREVALPIGVDMRTVSVRSGEELLQIEKNYVILPKTNRIRILNEGALTSKRHIRIAYEHPNLTITTVSH